MISKLYLKLSKIFNKISSYFYMKHAKNIEKPKKTKKTTVKSKVKTTPEPEVVEKVDVNIEKETDKDNAITKLKNLGLTEDEAKAYIGEE